MAQVTHGVGAAVIISPCKSYNEIIVCEFGMNFFTGRQAVEVNKKFRCWYPFTLNKTSN